MGYANAKRSANLGAAWAGAAARITRGGKISSRAGRRAALLNVMTAMYANASRGQQEGTEDNRTPGDRN